MPLPYKNSADRNSEEKSDKNSDPPSDQEADTQGPLSNDKLSQGPLSDGEKQRAVEAIERMLDQDEEQDGEYTPSHWKSSEFSQKQSWAPWSEQQGKGRGRREAPTASWVVRGPRAEPRVPPGEDANHAPSHDDTGRGDAILPPRCTTVLLRNLVGKLTHHDLLERVPEYQGVINFAYVPMDFNSMCNLGYGFVNFVDHASALQFARAMHGTHGRGIGKAGKAMSVQAARVQGLSANIRRFRNSSVMAVLSEHLKPVLLRNGERIPFPLPDAAPAPAGREWSYESAEYESAQAPSVYKRTAGSDASTVRMDVPTAASKWGKGGDYASSWDSGESHEETEAWSPWMQHMTPPPGKGPAGYPAVSRAHRGEWGWAEHRNDFSEGYRLGLQAAKGAAAAAAAAAIYDDGYKGKGGKRMGLGLAY